MGMTPDRDAYVRSTYLRSTCDVEVGSAEEPSILLAGLLDGWALRYSAMLGGSWEARVVGSRLHLLGGQAGLFLDDPVG